MKRSAGLKRTPIRRVSRKRAAAQGAYARAKAEAFEAAEGLCQARIPDVCTGAAQDLHHVRPRGRGAPLVPEKAEDAAMLCRQCHSWAHANTRLARERGLLK